jgi:crotonobetainyl-CoA:carnitine CoA-transferase CaiB-like acyl-CoA transferase
MAAALSGLRVLDLSMNLPGPYLTWLLACLGARVVKVENPQGGDYARNLGADLGTGPPYFQAVNRGKLSLALNLKHEQGRDVLVRLLQTHDILVEGFRPGALERLGLGYADLARVQPRLIQVSISGYGQDGPYRLRAGHDLNYLALAGVLGLSGGAGGGLGGWPGSGPSQPGVQVADLFGGSLMALAGLLAAVIERQSTGRGQLVDVAMYDGSLSLATMILAGVAAGLEEPRPGGMVLNGRHPCYNLYRCADGGWMSLGALEPKFWANFCAVVQRPDLVSRQFGGAEEIAQVRDIFSQRTRKEWTALLAGHDCCCEPVLGLSEAVESPLAQARGMVSRDEAGLPWLNCPLKLGGDPPAGQELARAPALGQHTREVLAEAGFSAAEVQRMLVLGAAAAGNGGD